jgi:hypothetical protein
MKNVRPRATKTRLQELSELSAGTTVTAPPAVFTNPEPPKPSIPQYNAVNTDSQNTARQIDPPHQTGSLSGETVTIAARAKALKEKLAEPAGIREAYTLREILDRPIAFRPRYVHGRYGKKI